MDRDAVIALAREAGCEIRNGHAYNPHTGSLDQILKRFAALVEEHLKAEGYRHCAKGQRTTQWCGMLEQAVRSEREECAKIAEAYEPICDTCPSGVANAIRSRT